MFEADANKFGIVGKVVALGTTGVYSNGLKARLLIV